MNMDRTPEETEQYFIEGMGKELGSLFYMIWNEVSWLYEKWNEYLELFGTNKERVDLLNKAASSFFTIIQDTLFKDTILHINRLTDPVKSCNKDNLTIMRLPDLVVDKIKSDVESLTEIADEKAEFCRDWRNRLIAHTDLKLAMKNEAKPLEPASRAKIREAIEAIAKVLIFVANDYLKTTLIFDPTGENGALDLLYVIDDGLEVPIKAEHKPRVWENSNPDEI